MARKSKPWFREDRGQWYVQHRGRQVRLGSDKVEAEKRWHTLMSLSQVDTAGDLNPFKVVADEFLDWVQRHRKVKTYRTYRMHLESFGRVHGEVAIKNLKPLHVDGVVKANRQWSKSTTRGFMVCVSTTLNWAVKQGYATFNPLAKKLPIPPIVSRGRASLISDDDYAKMLAHARPRLKEFLIACRHSGTRPHIVASVTAAHFNEVAKAWVLDEHKTDDTGEPLVVHLTDTLLALTRALIVQHPDGPLFRNARGNRWTDTAWGKAMAGLRKTMKAAGEEIEGRGIMYGFRHSFATDLLEKKVPEAHVAALLGHKSTTMLSKHYSHLTSRAAALKVHLGHIGVVAGEVTDAGAAGRPAAPEQGSGGPAERPAPAGS